jgi:hypothetical protein
MYGKVRKLTSNEKIRLAWMKCMILWNRNSCTWCSCATWTWNDVYVCILPFIKKNSHVSDKYSRRWCGFSNKKARKKARNVCQLFSCPTISFWLKIWDVIETYMYYIILRFQPFLFYIHWDILILPTRTFRRAVFFSCFQLIYTWINYGIL